MSIDTDPTLAVPETQTPAIDNMHDVLTALRDETAEITLEGKALEVGRTLGKGGSKTVKEVLIDGERLALALPNSTDSEDVASKKWDMVLKEPENTKKIRDLGIPTNPLSERLQMEVNGLPFDLVVMAPYDATGYEVRDRKNRQSSVMVSELLPDQFDSANAAGVLSDIIGDVTTLIEAGVQVGSDSVNICKDPQGRLRIYLNDLGGAEFVPIDVDKLRDVAGQYVGGAINALINGLDEDEWNKHRDFLEGAEMNQYSGGPVFNSLIDTVIARVGAK